MNESMHSSLNTLVADMSTAGLPLMQARIKQFVHLWNVRRDKALGIDTQGCTHWWERQALNEAAAGVLTSAPYKASSDCVRIDREHQHYEPVGFDYLTKPAERITDNAVEMLELAGASADEVSEARHVSIAMQASEAEVGNDVQMEMSMPTLPAPVLLPDSQSMIMSSQSMMMSSTATTQSNLTMSSNDASQSHLSSSSGAAALGAPSSTKVKKNRTVKFTERRMIAMSSPEEKALAARVMVRHDDDAKAALAFNETATLASLDGSTAYQGCIMDAVIKQLRAKLGMQQATHQLTDLNAGSTSAQHEVSQQQSSICAPGVDLLASVIVCSTSSTTISTTISTSTAMSAGASACNTSSAVTTEPAHQPKKRRTKYTSEQVALTQTLYRQDIATMVGDQAEAYLKQLKLHVENTLTTGGKVNDKRDRLTKLFDQQGWTEWKCPT